MYGRILLPHNLNPLHRRSTPQTLVTNWMVEAQPRNTTEWARVLYQSRRLTRSLSLLTLLEVSAYWDFYPLDGMSNIIKICISNNKAPRTNIAFLDLDFASMSSPNPLKPQCWHLGVIPGPTWVFGPPSCSMSIQECMCGSRRHVWASRGATWVSWANMGV